MACGCCIVLARLDRRSWTPPRMTHDSARARPRHAGAVRNAEADRSQHALLLAALHDPDALVARCAADALGRHPQFENIRPLLGRAALGFGGRHASELHVIRMALRDQLLVDEQFCAAAAGAVEQRSTSKRSRTFALGVPRGSSAKFLLRHLQKYPREPRVVPRITCGTWRVICRKREIGELVEFTRETIQGRC